MRKIVLVYLIIAAMPSVVAAQVNKVEKQSAPTLELTVKTDQQTYRMSDKIRMETQLLNAGNEDVYIWEWDLCWNPARGLSMYLTASDGSACAWRLPFRLCASPTQRGQRVRLYQA